LILTCSYRHNCNCFHNYSQTYFHTNKYLQSKEQLILLVGWFFTTIKFNIYKDNCTWIKGRKWKLICLINYHIDNTFGVWVVVYWDINIIRMSMNYYEILSNFALNKWHGLFQWCLMCYLVNINLFCSWMCKTYYYSFLFFKYFFVCKPKRLTKDTFSDQND
jgi:hypothetical protein